MRYYKINKSFGFLVKDQEIATSELVEFISRKEYESLADEPAPEEIKPIYKDEVERLIRIKYSLNGELAILRKKESEPEEFEEYFNYVEQCKLLAR